MMLKKVPSHPAAIIPALNPSHEIKPKSILPPKLRIERTSKIVARIMLIVFSFE